MGKSSETCYKTSLQFHKMVFSLWKIENHYKFYDLCVCVRSTNYACFHPKQNKMKPKKIVHIYTEVNSSAKIKSIQIFKTNIYHKTQIIGKKT